MARFPFRPKVEAGAEPADDEQPGTRARSPSRQEKAIKIVNLATYVTDAALVAQVRSQHLRYVVTLLDQGRLITGGPYADGSGALFVYDVESMDDAREIVANDPYTMRGVVAAHELKRWKVVAAAPALLPDPDSRLAGS